MKRFVPLALALVLSVGTTAFAQPCSNDGGCSGCMPAGQATQGSPDGLAAGENDAYRRFRLNTLDLRQEMMNRRFEMQRENLQATPNLKKIAALKADVVAIQARISDIRLKSGIPEDGKRDGECYKPDAGCGYGQGGCSGGPCWQ